MSVLFVLALLATQDAAVPRCAEGWKLEIVAQAPRLLHPSVVCCAPDGRIFVGEDRIDMEGPIDQAVDRILCLHPDGRTTVFAEGLGPVFGMMYLEGRLFVAHVPKFSVFRDREGVAAGREDLLECMNPTPSAGNGLNDHIPANFHLGIDGYLYMAVGQKGIYGAVGRDGLRFEMREGGILRMRPDATGLEVFARGVRNILDLAMTSEDEIFAYDNDDHTKTWKVKLIHMVDGGYYGFPWDIKPPRPYILGGLKEFSGGAPTGVLAYTEDALPPEYHDNLILCDWGRRSVQRVRLAPDGASYRAESIQDLIPAGGNDFRPVGITTAPDGMSFYISDWNFAGWKQKKEAGRLFKLSWTGRISSTPKPAWYLPSALGRECRASLDELVAALAHPSRSVRLEAERQMLAQGSSAIPRLQAFLRDSAASRVGRRHALWALDALDERAAALEAERLLSDPELRIEAIRELGTRRSKPAAKSIAGLLKESDPRVRFRAAAALGRIADPECVQNLLLTLADPDPFVRHGVFTALHRTGAKNAQAWKAVEAGLQSDLPLVRQGTLCSLREAYHESVVASLGGFLRDSGRAPEERASAVELLLALERMPAPWDGRWWRNGPYAFAEDDPKIGPRIDGTVEWAGTPQVREILLAAERDPSPLVRSRAAERSAPPVPPTLATGKSAGSLSPRPSLPRAAPEPYAEFAARNPGDPSQGREVFTDPKRGGCVRCHRVRGEGGMLGPDLGGVGSKYERAFLIESILYPSKQIAEGFAQTIVRTRSGQVLSGLIRSETSDALMLVDGEGEPHALRAAEIEIRRVSEVSLMPENLHAGLSHQDFADLVAFLASLKDDEGFSPLLNGKDLGGWKTDPANAGHWTAKDGGILFYDAQGTDLWTERSFGDFLLKVDWRFPSPGAGGKPPVEKDAPVILPDGSLSGKTQKVMDAGDSGIFLRGSQKSQVNIWCWPIGSGEIYGYRTDAKLPPEVRAAATPKARADRPPGEWNHFDITMKGERITVVLNGTTVIDDARLPGVPAKGPIGLQHPGNPLTRDMPLEFKNLLIKELP